MGRWGYKRRSNLQTRCHTDANPRSGVVLKSLVRVEPGLAQVLVPVWEVMAPEVLVLVMAQEELVLVMAQEAFH